MKKFIKRLQDLLVDFDEIIEAEEKEKSPPIPAAVIDHVVLNDEYSDQITNFYGLLQELRHQLGEHELKKVELYKKTFDTEDKLSDIFAAIRRKYNIPDDETWEYSFKDGDSAASFTKK